MLNLTVNELRTIYHVLEKEIKFMKYSERQSREENIVINNYDNIMKKIKDLGADDHMLKEDVKLLNEQLSDAKWWLVQILNNDENASDFQKYMREEFGEVIK